MPDDPEIPPRGYTTQDVREIRDDTRRRHGFARRHWMGLTLTLLILVPAVVVMLWTTIALHLTYSSGDRVGYVQKFSHKGWVCKTWEGELAMNPVPGSIPQIFRFSVRDDSVARLINESQGKQVALHYAEHHGVPGSCFGETNYYITGMRQVK